MGSAATPISGPAVIGVRFKGADGSWSNTFRSVVVVQQTASVQVSVEDELTYLDNSAPLVAGAHVVISDTSTSAVYADGFSDATGVFFASGLPSGTHHITVSEPIHFTHSGTISLIAGDTLDARIFIGRAPDGDNDGYTANNDCNDTDATIHPGAPEVCDDGIDNDCDGSVDEAIAYYADVDGDGSGDPAADSLSCAPPGGYVTDNTDLCPNDPNKTAPGTCGCGRPDGDLNTNGIVDCLEDCDLDPTFNTADLGFGLGDGMVGTVVTSVVQPDGKILIGGIFSSYNGTSRNRVARVNSDGTRDDSFVPGTGANGNVWAIALQPDGKILISGEFTSYNGTSRNRIARLNSDGSLDTGFNPGTGASANVRAMALQGDGKIVIGGDFNTYNGTSRNRIARLNSDGSLDTGFIVGTGVGTGANDLVFAIALQPDGKVLITGGFIAYNGTTRNRLARLNSDGSLDTSLDPGLGASSTMNAMVLQPDGKILIGGGLTTYNGTSRRGIARVNSDGSLDTGFNPGTGATSLTSVLAIALRADGQIKIGGNFTVYNGSPQVRIASLNSDGSLDGAFGAMAGANDRVYSIVDLPDGKILVGGSFTEFNGVATGIVGSLIRLNSDGGVDGTFNPGGGANSSVRSVAVQSDGKVMIGGDFLGYNRVPRSRIARMNPDGSMDLSFNPGTGTNGTVNAFAIQADGKIVFGGSFQSFNGSARNNIGRLNSNGTYDTGFNNSSGPFSAAGAVNAVLLQPDGKVLIGGAFTSYNSSPRNRVARLNSNGSNDTGFLPGTGANGTVRCMALQPDGKILIGGDFTAYNGTARNRVARLNTNGSLDLTFDPGAGAGAGVLSMTLRPDGKVLIGGAFTTYNGTTRNRIARLNTDGSLDLTFDPGTGADNAVNAMTLQPDGRVLLGGDFTSYNGTMRNRIARVTETGGLDLGFFPGSGADATVSAIALQPDGQVLLVGSFISYNGIGRNRVARIVSCECPVGLACNDNSACTTNDILGADCQCAGTLLDADADGTCDADDLCTGGPEPGTACDDNNACTTNDVIGTNCQCAGTIADADSDGTCDADDGCPTDPLKTTAGTCGCGVADTDTDNDGTADCTDGCPNDPLKIIAGACGCGVTDVDSDNDSSADCIDGCPNDPLKTTAGSCGCGVTDTDADNDGTADCIDGCPNDPLKTTAGACGCGIPDADTDNDGAADCIDGCPSDPLKTTAGACGCGIADTDSDNDGTANCNDGCPNDPLKTNAGLCGCGVVDSDSDNDGTSDCIDACPNDPLKTTVGICGCGAPDTDSDNDGTADCNDGCPNDPLKTAAGSCGCGIADTDSDNDGTADCIDGCPNDPLKTNAGICGCGVNDADTDNDGTADCNDGCPTDPLKTSAGNCGCGIVDVATTWFNDADGDGFGDPSNALPGYTCLQPAGHVPNAIDCNDADAAINPMAYDACTDGIDNNCNGLVDEQAGMVGQPCSSTIGACQPGVWGCVANVLTCVGGTLPSAEICSDGIDNDCDGQVDEVTPETVPLTWYLDLDGDGYGSPDTVSIVHSCDPQPGYALNSNDCNDNNAAVNPGATELCNGLDDNCDGNVESGPIVAWYADVDGDGFGDAAVEVLTCIQPVGFVSVAGDCDDQDPGIHPGAPEVCNGLDDDCDGAIDGLDPGAVLITWYLDADGDGSGSPADTVIACAPPIGYVAQGADCDDNDPSINPMANDACPDGIDNNCNGLVDEQAAMIGQPCGSSVGQCVMGTWGCANNVLTCIGGVAATAEICSDGIDNDCDGQVDEISPETVPLTWYVDADADGFGNPDTSLIVLSCDPLPGYAISAGDCNDQAPNIDPAQPEVCNGIDDNCNGSVDEGIPAHFADADGDGLGDPTQPVPCTTPGAVTNNSDCDDNDPVPCGTVVMPQLVERRVIGSTGSATQVGTVRVEWTLGEPVVTTVEDQGLRLTQGFHQSPSLKLRLNLRALLQGPFVSPSYGMIDSLRTRGLIPLEEPYTALGYVHVGGGGETTTAGVLTTAGPDAVVDWIVVELRAPSTPDVVMASRAGLLQRDGDIVDVDGTSPLAFKAPSADYQVAVIHRNHLPVITATPTSVSTTPAVIDLTDGSTLLYGAQPVRVDGAMHMLWCGDVNGDGTIRYTGALNDRDPILVGIGGIIPTNTTSGYAPEDVNMDGTIKYTGTNNDRDPILQNIGGTVPTNVRNAQMP